MSLFGIGVVFDRLWCPDCRQEIALTRLILERTCPDCGRRTQNVDRETLRLLVNKTARSAQKKGTTAWVAAKRL